MLRLLDRSKGVPNHFRYVHSENGYESTGVNWWDMWNDVTKHRAANGYPAVTEAEVEHQICLQAGPAYCQEEEPTDTNRRFVNTRLKWGDIVQGTKAYVAFIASGFKTVSQQEADRRARICSSCYLRVQPQGCGACLKISTLIVGDVAGKKTAYDDKLSNRACAICSCPNKAIVHFPIALLEQADKAGHQDAYPFFCWRKIGGENYVA